MKKITLIATLFIAPITSSCSRESQIESNDVQTVSCLRAAGC